MLTRVIANNHVKFRAVPTPLPETNRPFSPSDVLLGKALSSIEKLPSRYWVFHFGDAVWLNVEAPWRVLSPSSILVTSEDDSQKFGMKTPVDAAATLRRILESHQVTLVVVDPVSSDLRIQFDNEATLEVVNLSSGYECWTLNRNDGFIMVGRNG